jgi:hypothetical protein
MQKVKSNKNKAQNCQQQSTAKNFFDSGLTGGGAVRAGYISPRIKALDGSGSGKGTSCHTFFFLA